MDCVISDPCSKGTVLQRNYRKMTIKFLNEKLYGQKKKWEPHDHVTSKPVFKMSYVMKGLYCLFIFTL